MLQHVDVVQLVIGHVAIGDGVARVITARIIRPILSIGAVQVFNAIVALKWTHNAYRLPIGHVGGEASEAEYIFFHHINDDSGELC